MDTFHASKPSARASEFAPLPKPLDYSAGRGWAGLRLVLLGLLVLTIATVIVGGILVWVEGRHAMAAAERERATAMQARARQQAAAAQENATRRNAATDMYGGGMASGMDSMGGAEYEGGYGMGVGMEGGGYGMGYGSPSGPGMPSAPPANLLAARQQLEAQLAPLVQRLREAQADEQKAAVKQQMSSILEGYFDQDMQRRLKELAEIEARVRRLKEQSEQRQQAKTQILELQLKVLENEAAGLGFFGAAGPSASAQQASGMMGGMPGMSGGYGDTMSGMMPGGPMAGDMGSMMSMGGMSDMGMGGMMGMGLPGSGMTMRPGSGLQVPAPFLKRTALDFLDTPLQDVCAWLRDQSGTNIYLDPQAFNDMGIDSQLPVTLNIRDISLAGALELLADHVSDQLGVRFEDGVAMLTHRDYAPVRPETDRWPSSQRTASLLNKSADYEFIEVSLEEALEMLRDAAQIDVFLNRRSLEKAEVSPDTPVSLNLKGVPHRTALKLLLHNLDRSLYYVLVDGVVVVAAKEKAPPATGDPNIASPPAESAEAPPTGSEPEQG